MLTLEYSDISTFTEKQIKQTSKTIRLLGDERLKKYLQAFKTMKEF